MQVGVVVLSGAMAPELIVLRSMALESIALGSGWPLRSGRTQGGMRLSRTRMHDWAVAKPRLAQEAKLKAAAFAMVGSGLSLGLVFGPLASHKGAKIAQMGICFKSACVFAVGAGLRFRYLIGPLFASVSFSTRESFRRHA
jgi:hypothetical protein